MIEIDNKSNLIKEFIQKRGLNYRKFSLYQNKIIVETKTIKKIEKYEVQIENLGFDTVYQAENTLVGKIWLYICLTLPIIFYILQLFPSQRIPITNLIIIHVGCWLFAFFNYIKQHQDDIILKGRKDLEFYRDIPDEKSVLIFIELVKTTTKNYLKRRHFNTDNYIDDNEFNHTMKWLLNQDIISISEYKSILDDYKLKNI
jgi:hypothetical protein